MAWWPHPDLHLPILLQILFLHHVAIFLYLGNYNYGIQKSKHFGTLKIKDLAKAEPFGMLRMGHKSIPLYIPIFPYYKIVLRTCWLSLAFVIEIGIFMAITIDEICLSELLAMLL